MKISKTVIYIVIGVLLIGGISIYALSTYHPVGGEVATTTNAEQIKPINPSTNDEHSTVSAPVKSTIVKPNPGNSDQNEYHFSGTVKNSTIEAGVEILTVTQKSSWNDAGLYNGDKGDIRMENGTCGARTRNLYSFIVTYNKAENIYLCKQAKLGFYD